MLSSPLRSTGSSQSQTSRRRRRSGLWALAGVEAEAFAETPQIKSQWPFARRSCLRVVMWVTLLVCERRVNADGTALLMLNPRPGRSLRRLVAVGAGWFVVLLGLAVVWVPLFWAAVAVQVAFLGPLVVASWGSRTARRQLKSFGPKEPSRYVHSVASVERGAGAMVMSDLAAEADGKGWLLALDTGHPRLVEYYQAFGFSVLGHPVETRWGHPMVRMARIPVMAGE